MLEVTARDVVGTAAMQAANAVTKLQSLLSGMTTYGSREDALSDIATLLGRAQSDCYLAMHQLSHDWEDTTYLGRWGYER